MLGGQCMLGGQYMLGGSVYVKGISVLEVSVLGRSV